MSIRLLCLSALFIVTAGCADEAPPEPAAAHDPQKTAPAHATRTPPARIHPAPRCTAGDLTVRIRPEGDGAGQHSISLLDFRNVGSSRCALSGHPRRVTLSGPGHPDVRATNGSFFPVQRRGPLDPGEVATLGVETATSCDARPTGGPSGPFYRDVRISLPGGVVTVTDPTPGLDVGCGVHLTRFGLWQ